MMDLVITLVMVVQIQVRVIMMELKVGLTMVLVGFQQLSVADAIVCHGRLL